ncbi:MAG: PHB depolymerase family esterase [Lautropia sp.]
MVDGRDRRYVLNLPPGHEAMGKVPLVIAMHGGGGSAAQFEEGSLLTRKADASGFAVAYPEGTARTAIGLKTWNAGGCCGSAVAQQVDDVKFIEAMIDDIAANWPIDLRRVHATGHSNGGMMAYRLACDLSTKIASIAPNAAALVHATCAPSRPVAVLHMHSRRDRNVPVAGGKGVGISGVSYPSLDATIGTWVRLDGCRESPQVDAVAGRYTRTRWTACGAQSEVRLLLTEDGGHAWPGGIRQRAVADAPSTAIDANDEIWAFFRAHRLR